MTASILALGCLVFGFFLQQNPRENLVVSPYSLHQSLSMTAEGTGQNCATRDEMLKVLGNPLLPVSLDGQSHLATFASGNSIWTKCELNSQFLERTGAYNATVKQLDVTSSDEDQSRRVNEWVSEKTQHLIKDIVTPGVLHDSELILLNAIYFKSEWAKHFNVAAKQVFNEKGGPIPFMQVISSMRHYKTDTLEAVRVPFKDSKWAAHIILPDKSSSVATIATQEHISDVLEHLQSDTEQQMTSCKLVMPEFDIQWGESLRPVLSKEMPTAFSRRANFDEMCAHPPCKLQIRDVLQKSVLKVNRFGTEAASATAVVMMARALVMQQQDPVPIIVDRPFLFIITHENVPVFLAAVHEPASAEAAADSNDATESTQSKHETSVEKADSVAQTEKPNIVAPRDAAQARPIQPPQAQQKESNTFDDEENGLEYDGQREEDDEPRYEDEVFQPVHEDNPETQFVEEALHEI